MSIVKPVAASAKPQFEWYSGSYRNDRCLCWAAIALRRGRGAPTYGYANLLITERVPILSIANLESLPTKEACIDRPGARSEQCQSGT
jgi:hypothetical protein